MGSSLAGKDAETIVPLSVEIIHHITNVYNFEVDDNHNYFVGPLGILVHNACNDRIVVNKNPTPRDMNKAKNQALGGRDITF